MERENVPVIGIVLKKYRIEAGVDWLHVSHMNKKIIIILKRDATDLSSQIIGGCFSLRDVW